MTKIQNCYQVDKKWVAIITDYYLCQDIFQEKTTEKMVDRIRIKHIEFVTLRVGTRRDDILTMWHFFGNYFVAIVIITP